MGSLCAISPTDLQEQQKFRRVHQKFLRQSKNLFKIAGKRAIGITAIMAKRLLLISGRAFTRSFFLMAGWLGRGVLFAVKALLRKGLSALI